MKRLAILGSTGSIGRQTLDVVRTFPDRYSVSSLVAGSQWQEVAEQIREFNVPFVAMRDAAAVERLREAVGPHVTVLHDAAAEAAVRDDVDMVVVALVGIAGLVPTLRALEAGKPIALVNKEALVVGGSLVMQAAHQRHLPILPVDSEHSAVFQCLQGEDAKSVERIILTCSGGPFRHTPTAELENVTLEAALNHPNWKMGAKITVDSATLMNKGFEVLEAHHLYGLGLDRIDVVIHPQSVIHSMVEFVDGSIMAQLSPPDMRLPIQYALAWPERLPKVWQKTDFTKLPALTFEAPRRDAFPCLELAYEAGRRGGVVPAVLNGANEVAVARFLNHELRYSDISRLLADAVEQAPNVPSPQLSDLLSADREARQRARSWKAAEEVRT